MRVALFIPCYIDQFFPRIGMATVELLEQHSDCEIVFPEQQTCCGQPMANTGCLDDTRPLAEKFVSTFSDFDHVVCPSGSCVSMVRNHYQGYFQGDSRYTELKSKTWELCEFLLEVLDVHEFTHPFPHKVGLHSSCHGLRELRLDACSERMDEQASKVRRLLQMVPDLELAELERSDECCGFGGTFAVAEEGVSLLMGEDRIADHLKSGAEVMTATDASCLMHMDGIVRRQSLGLPTMHVAEILAGHPLSRPDQTVPSST